MARFRTILASMLATCLLGMLLAMTACRADTKLEANGLRIMQAEFVQSAGNRAPEASAPWTPVTLPDLWKIRHPDTHGTAWYRMEFDYPQLNAQEIYALYLSRLSLNAEAYLNGTKIGSGGAFDEPIARHWNRPLLFMIPPTTLKPRGNTLFIRVIAPQGSQGMLYPPEINLLQHIQPRYEQAKFVRTTLNQTSSLLIVGIGLLMLSLWWRRKQDTAYGLFGLAAFVWALQSLNFYIITAPLPTALWELFVNASFQAIAALWLISLLDFVGIRLHRFNQLLWGMLILSPLSLLLTPAAYFMNLTDFWHLTTMIVVIFGLALLARASFIQHNKDAKLLLTTLSIILLFAFHDWLIHNNIPGFNHWLVSGEEYLMQFSAPMLFLIVGLMMTSRYVGVLNNYEQLNQELEQRVVSKHEELNHNFQQLQSILKEQATLEERERIYQDLHDDLGAKLLTLVYRAQDSNNAELARSALQDLRDVVSRAGADSVPFNDAMADFRIECDKRLSDVQIQLHWDNQLNDDRLHLTQPQALNLGRIIREAISNVIRHAEASAVNITLQPTAHHIALLIEDNGIGLQPDTDKSKGRGLGNIQKRAALLGGEVQVGPSIHGGLRLCITLPQSSISYPPC
ncbi:sensor histidine kinase [Methylophilus aquaticus]|uniref:histidine kinase n=1 Tax=Methylophilus aquaticus TaxID=1971610 RepID=A0ABT9JVM9_9PROT|nr:ATP-binding protein [Methylophilus aquaticus]MDP8568520.1 7TM diverse intracellular signaling domain-containing protein [Methylophilus aquaticus]